MNHDICQIYNRKKRIGILPCQFFKKTELYEEHYVMPNTYKLKPDYILLINNCEKLYVTDIRVCHSEEEHIEVYFETVAKHKEKTETRTLARASIVISILALISSAISIILDFFD